MKKSIEQYVKGKTDPQMIPPELIKNVVINRKVGVFNDHIQSESEPEAGGVHPGRSRRPVVDISPDFKPV